MHHHRSWRGLAKHIIAAASVVIFSTAAQADYQSTVLGDSPLSYYRLNEILPVPSVAVNNGSLGATGNGIHAPGVIHRVQGALTGNGNAAAGYDGVGAHHTQVPYLGALNPASSSPFTIEAWFNPTVEVSDAPGPCPLFNRVSSGNRSGWIFFQRSTTTGWNFRMYNGSGSSLGIDLSGGSNAQGTWSHVVAVWNGSQASLYCNGVLVAGPTSPTGGYNASTAAIFSVGSYDDGENPFNGAVDEVAFYPTALTGAQILAHYQNGTNAAPATPYSSLVTSNGALEYLRLDERDPTIDTAMNNGLLGPLGDGVHFPGMKHQVPGAIVGNSDTAASYSAIDASSQDGGVPTTVPFNADINPSSSFTVEYWVKPAVNGNAGNAQSPMFNRDPNDGNAPNRAGWDMFQRDSGTGWNFRMFNGNAHDKVFDITGGAYTVGAWSHLVAVYNSAIPSATLYLNGVQVAQSTSPNGTYAANTYAPLSIGGYSDGVQNPFIGSIDEVAIYTNALSAAQILAHYQNGTNAARATPYDQLVLSQRAVEYLRLDESAVNTVNNLGTLGAAAAGTYVNTTSDQAGPQSPAFPGFATNNAAANFDGLTSYLELVNPAGLNFSGQVTLEAWIQPAGSQNFEAYIIAHGGNDTFSAEDALRIENGNYQILSYNGTSHAASYPVPAGDLGGGNWIHLAGTYDGANWNLYRNGVLVATTPDSTGLLPVANANWAVGARGRWKNGSGFPASGEDRQFTGLIDEPAIYNHALTAQQIQAHYSAGAFGPHPLAISFAGGSVTLTYSNGTLQSATDVAGPYTDVAGASSPYTVTATGPKKFFRLRF